MIGPVVAVATADAAAAMRLAGLPVEVAGAGEPVEQALLRAVQRHGPALLLVEDGLLDRLGTEAQRRWERERRPVLLAWPGPVWVERPPGEAEVVELIRRAIGYRVRL